jgi:hypothetical protein
MDLEGLQPPPAMLGYGGGAGAADAAAADAGANLGPPSLDEAFADILSGLMNESLLPATAIQQLRHASAAATQAYREDASAMLHRAAHRLHMFELAAEQESQAASWLLMQVCGCRVSALNLSQTAAHVLLCHARHTSNAPRPPQHTSCPRRCSTAAATRRRACTWALMTWAGGPRCGR